LSVSTNTNAVALSIGASNTDMSYIRRLSTAVFQWQTYNGTNAGQIQLQPYGGNVGIGLTAPTAKLNVLSSTSLSSVFKAEGINGTLFEVTDDLSNSLMSVNTIGGLPVFEVFANNTIIAGQYNANDLVITGNKVGVGTANPSFKLDVNGSFGLNAGANDGNWPFLVVDTSSSGGPNRYALNKIGAMGFNNADNYAQLQLVGSSGAYIDFANAAVDDSDARIIYYSNSRFDIQYGTVMTINSTGVGIGTTSPGYLLSVNTANDVWHAQFGQVGGNQLRIGGNTTNGGVIGAYSDNTNNNPRQLLLNRDGGNVAVGASSANNKLHVNGSTSIGSSYNTAGPTDGLIVQGSVGIGVTSPDANAKLHVYGNDAHKYIFYTDTAGSSSTIFQRNNAAESVVLTLANTRGPSVGTDRGTSLNLDLGYGGSSVSAGTLARGAKISAFSSASYTSTASTQNAYLAFYTALAGSLTEKMRIDSNGNVGIGTVSPSTTLHLNSTTSGATLLRADGTNGILFSVVDDLSDSLMSVNNSAGLPVLEVFADDRVVAGQYGANDFVLVNNKLGLGIINPVFKLDVNGTGAFRDTVYIGPNIGTITWGNFGGGTGFGMRSEVGRALSLGANGSFDYIVINTSGSVGIGATNPATLLQIGTGTPTSVTGGIQFGGDTGARIYRINSSTIQVSNNLIVGGTLTESSSIRYKENIKTVSAPILSKLEGIRPVTYNKKDNPNNTEYGIIAEELNEIFPEFVNKNDNGEIESVNYSRLTVLLIKAVKELKQEIDILKNK
jgi:hypothetical protein